MENKLPTINIKGKEYVQVKDRIISFNEKYPNGYIRTKLLSDIASDRIIMKAIVMPDIAKPERYFEDYAQEEIGQGLVNKTSALENASTSCVGRALALMGIGVIESIASADEVNKAKNREYQPSNNSYQKPAYTPKATPTQTTEQQLNQEEKKDLTCTECLSEISVAEYEFSKKKFGKALCRKCQGIARGNE